MIDPAHSFGRTADAYEASRPSYPDALLDVLPLGPEATVLDLGAGTGKLTRVLVRRYARVVAVEPLDEMRAVLEQVVPEVESHPGTAEAIPLEDASVDGVFAAQAFHWFANEQALAEIARVLRPAGLFADVWNDTIDPSPLPDAFVARIEELFHAAPYTGMDDGRRTEVVRGGPFGESRLASVEHAQLQDRAAVLAFISSVSAVARLPMPERAAVLADLGGLLPEGTYRFRIRANVRWAVRA